MLPLELMKKIHRLEIRTNRLVEEALGGAYHSVFKGRGIEFDEVREYTYEDDIRDIDWNVSARMGTPYIKKYIEERELAVILAVDVSASGNFGSGDKTKRDAMAELAAMIAFSAGSNNDKVGLLLFSDQIELFLPPRSGRKHALRLIRELMAFAPKGKGTDINLALSELSLLLNKQSVIFVLSDFMCVNNYETRLKILNKRHDVIGVRVTDPVEMIWPLDIPVNICDSESGKSLYFAGGKSDRQQLLDAVEDDSLEIRNLLKRAKVDLIELPCGEDPLNPLIRFFERRRRKS